MALGTSLSQFGIAIAKRELYRVTENKSESLFPWSYIIYQLAEKLPIELRILVTNLRGLRNDPQARDARESELVRYVYRYVPALYSVLREHTGHPSGRLKFGRVPWIAVIRQALEQKFPQCIRIFEIVMSEIDQPPSIPDIL